MIHTLTLRLPPLTPPPPPPNITPRLAPTQTIAGSELSHSPVTCTVLLQVYTHRVRNKSDNKHPNIAQVLLCLLVCLFALFDYAASVFKQTRITTYYSVIANIDTPSSKHNFGSLFFARFFVFFARFFVFFARFFVFFVRFFVFFARFFVFFARFFVFFVRFFVFFVGLFV